MKKMIALLLLSVVLIQCESAKKEKKVYPAGDRAGADTSLVNLAGSQDLAELLCQRWDNKEDHEDVKDASDKLQLPFRGFYFFRDGSMVKNPRDDMKFGTWSFDEKTKLIKICLQNGIKEDYVVHAIAYDEMVLSKSAEKGPSVKYIADGFVHKDLVQDPFYPPNMQWRVKPQHAEDDAAIHRRIRACLHFYKLYYEDNVKRNARLISFYGLPGCFKWYAGGISLKTENKLDKPWTDIFYNEADASKGYQLLDKMISKKYNWDKNETNWVRQNGGVLQQMEAKIDSL